MSVPFPAPDGPEMTMSLAMALRLRGRLEELDQLPPLARSQTDDGLGRTHPALLEHLGGLDLSELGNRHDQVEDLGGVDVLGRVGQDVADVDAASLKLVFEACPLGANAVGTLERFHALLVASLWCLRLRLCCHGVVGHAPIILTGVSCATALVICARVV